jgi:5-methylcytosine-specific restriction protein B
MNNPFNLPDEKLLQLLKGYDSWLESDPNEAKYPQIFRDQAVKIKQVFLNTDTLRDLSDEDLYKSIYDYSRQLEGKAYRVLPSDHIWKSIKELRRNLEYVLSSKEEPAILAQNIIDGKFKIKNFSKAFWSPILQARFPEDLPNWNNKTEDFLGKFGINVSTYKLSTADRYNKISEAFRYLSMLISGHDFFTINHLMHYGTAIEEGSNLIDRLQGREISDPVAEMINSYKEKLRKDGLKDEIYKWELVKKFRGRPDLKADDFFEEVKSVDYKNLVYEMAVVVKNHIAKDLPEEYRECFRKLFTDEKDLNSRVKGFMDDVLRTYRKLEPKYSHHHDERTIATFLTFYNPDKYAFFKDSFYQKYCKLINVKAKDKGEKYSHYLQLINEFRDKYILTDTELLQLIESCMNPDCFDDSNHLILAQDILFQILDKGNEIIEISTEKIFKISMGDFETEEFRGAVSKKIVLVRQDTKAKGTSSLTQGEVFRDLIKDGDYFYLTHGNRGIELLGRFVGECRPAYKEELASEGWLERTYDRISSSWNRTSYKAKKKWWTPNENSTCVEIPGTELEEANKLIFIPYFNTSFSNIDGIIEEPESPPLTKPGMDLDVPLNTILYGPPGTGKTYYTVDLAVQIAAPDKYRDNDHDANKEVYDTLVREGQVIFTTFHQSMCYEDFVEGIKPLKPGENDPYLKYDIEDGIFKKICSAAQIPNQIDFNNAYNLLQNRLTEHERINLRTPTGKEYSISLNRNGNLSLHTGESRNVQGTLTKENIQNFIINENVFDYWQGYFAGVVEYLRSEYNYRQEKETGNKNFVLIIDEINRGNVAQIFGELITLIEPDKRQGMKEALTVTLPYSKREFMVPANLYIVGTMNTADRSVEALDTALRRRFSFMEMEPLYNLNGMDLNIAGVKISVLLKTLNDRIEKMTDRDHRIGHSYFLGINNSKALMTVFRDKIIPLLQENFYGNYEKMGLILGKGFIEKIPDEKVGFANFSADENDFNDRLIYRINKESLEDTEKFESALTFLMNVIE